MKVPTKLTIKEVVYCESVRRRSAFLASCHVMSYSNERLNFSSEVGLFVLTDVII